MPCTLVQPTKMSAEARFLDTWYAQITAEDLLSGDQRVSQSERCEGDLAERVQRSKYRQRPSDTTSTAPSITRIAVSSSIAYDGQPSPAATHVG
jgi:hypothetical protein